MVSSSLSLNPNPNPNFNPNPNSNLNPNPHSQVYLLATTKRKQNMYITDNIIDKIKYNVLSRSVQF